MEQINASRRIAQGGTEISPQSIELVHSLYDAEQMALQAEIPATQVDLAYGPDERHVLDVYQPKHPVEDPAVVIFVHGGGFMRGDKGNKTRWENANAGSWAARAGHLGIVINYRLAPAHRWPAGADDLAAAIAWAKREALKYGANPNRIILIGTSAGACHVAGYLKQYSKARDIAGAVFLSGLYGVTPLADVRDFSYYGEDPELSSAMMPLEAVVETRTPLLIMCAQYDPSRFQEEFLGLVERRLQRHGQLDRAYIASGHNHFSLALHLGTADTRVSTEIWDFVSGLKISAA